MPTDPVPGEDALQAQEDERPYTADDINSEEALTYYGMTSGMPDAIVQTIARLPRAVQEFALHQCGFLSVGGDFHGHTAPAAALTGPDLREAAAVVAALPVRPYWVIVLDALILQDSDPEETASTIAHEIAHAWHGHDCRPEALGAPGALREALADAIAWEARGQAQLWGFHGRAAQP